MSHNFLRRYRRRGALSQRDVAALLGDGCATVVSRHEAASRLPSLKTALAYQAMFGVPVHELFPGEYREAVARITERAYRHSRHLRSDSTSTKAACRREFLAAIGTGKSGLSANNHDQQINRR